MVLVHTLEITPPVINASCAWASDYSQLRELYDCPHTGAVTTRTATLNGWPEDDTKTAVFDATSRSTLNNYGYSPYPLAEYISWVHTLLTTPTAAGSAPAKPILISITASDPTVLKDMLAEIQGLRARLHRAHCENPRMPGAPDPSTLVGVELNTSCPNIKDSAPLAYDFTRLTPLLDALTDAFAADGSLTIGLKLPPYLYEAQFQEVVNAIAAYSHVRRAGTGGESGSAPDAAEVPVSPFAYLACTNTLGNSLLFADQVVPASLPPSAREESRPYALASPLGGLGGDALHPLALGNIYTFASLLAAHPNPVVKKIVLVGIGGITSASAARRMLRAGARIVACASLLGREGVQGFESLLQA